MDSKTILSAAHCFYGDDSVSPGGTSGKDFYKIAKLYVKVGITNTDSSSGQVGIFKAIFDWSKNRLLDHVSLLYIDPHE